MASDDSSGARAAPIVIRIKLRYDDVEAMVQRFAANVGKSGLFLPTKALQPLGAEIKFELRLADDTPALVGLGRVKAATAPDADHPRAAFGMAIELMRVTPQSRALILRMLERRRALGLPEVALPMAADIDAARRAELATGPVPVVNTAPPVPPLMPAQPQGEGLMTAPRRTTGPMAVAKVQDIAALAPEPARRRRASMSELMETASGPVASLALPGLDDDVDVSAAIARARVLAGGALDAELEALVGAAEPPPEISIEEAMAALACLTDEPQGQRVADVAPDAGEPEAVPEIVAALGSAPVEPMPEAIATVPVEPEAVEPEAVEAVEPVEPAAVEPGAVEPAAEPDVVEAAAPAPVVEPAQIADVIHQLDELDLEDAEHTEMGAIPMPPEPAVAPMSVAAQVDLAASLEAELAAAEADDLALPPAPHAVSLDEFDDFEIIAEADAADEDLLTANAERETSGRHRAPTQLPPDDMPERASEHDFATRLDLDDDLDNENDFYIPPRRRESFDGAHADPLLDSAGQALAAFETGDESIDEPRDVEAPRAPSRSGDLPRIVEPIFETEQSNSYTLASIPSDDSLDLDLGPAVRDRAAPRPTKLPPPSRVGARGDRLPSLYASPVEDDELEQALGALDVDLDDLSIPQAGRTKASASEHTQNLRRTPSRPIPVVQPEPTPVPRRTSANTVPANRTRPTPAPMPKVTMDDGFEIDLDDD